MSTSHLNFYKPNSSKIKLSNVYPYDSFRPGNVNEINKRGKSCNSPNRVITQKEFFKSIKNTNFNNNFNSYNLPFKFNDSVILKKLIVLFDLYISSHLFLR